MARYWWLTIGSILFVAVSLYLWHLSIQPDPNAVCVRDGQLVKCPASGPWPAHHWFAASVIAAVAILLIGRALLFMHRMESRSR